MQTRTSRRASSRTSTARTSSSRGASKAFARASRGAANAASRGGSRGAASRAKPSRATGVKRWETPLRRAFFSDAGRFAASMGVGVDACVAHVRALQPEAGFNAIEADAIRASVLDLVLVIGGVQHAPQAWSELRLQHTWRLREALNTWSPSRDGGLQIERFWTELQAATERGAGLQAWDPRRPLSRWLADLLFGQVQQSRELMPTRPVARARAFDSLDIVEEARTLRFPLIAAVQ